MLLENEIGECSTPYEGGVDGAGLLVVAQFVRKREKRSRDFERKVLTSMEKPGFLQKKCCRDCSEVEISREKCLEVDLWRKSRDSQRKALTREEK